MESQGRNYSLDAARGILMMLGALLHAANIYAANSNWIIKDGEGSRIFDYMINFIHTFRMPAFFWISGFFCGMTFQRSGTPTLLRKRIPRILVPLLTTWLTLNVAQVSFLALINDQDVISTLLAGVPLYHLWFLVDLVVFIVIAAIVLPIAYRLPRTPAQSNDISLALLLLGASLASAILSAGVRSTGIAYQPIFNLTSAYRLATYAPFFFGGVLMFFHKNAQGSFLRIDISHVSVTLVIYLILKTLFTQDSLIAREISHFGDLLVTWMSVAVVLRLFHRFVKADSAVTRLLADSAYTVYLFHHFFVVLLGSFLSLYFFDSVLKFITVCIFSLTISMLIHVKLVRPHPVISKLFNGK